MQSTSNNINLSFIGQNQQYEELTLNQNYFIIDALIKGCAVDINILSFPSSPNDSDVYIFGNNATNSSMNNQIAIFNINLGWILINPKIGTKFYVLSKNTQYIFSNQNQWIVFPGYDQNLMNNLISNAENRSSHTGTQDLPSTTTGNLPSYRVSGLATVATSGSYTDLQNLPIIPSAQVISDWNSTSGISQILNKPTITGDYKFSAQNSNHGNWILCNGQAISRITYKTLFALIGISFGSGDGSTSFNVPDLRSSVPGGIGQKNGLSNRSIGQFTGEENHLLTIQEIPSHNHYLAGANSSGNAGIRSSSLISGSNPISGNYNGQTNNCSGAIDPTGAGQVHNNMQPTLFIGNLFIYAV